MLPRISHFGESGDFVQIEKEKKRQEKKNWEPQPKCVIIACFTYNAFTTKKWLRHAFRASTTELSRPIAITAVVGCTFICATAIPRRTRKKGNLFLVLIAPKFGLCSHFSFFTLSTSWTVVALYLCDWTIVNRSSFNRVCLARALFTEKVQGNEYDFVLKCF